MTHIVQYISHYFLFISHDNAFNDEFYNEVLNKKQEFENLSDEEQQNQSPYDSQPLNVGLTFEEVEKAIDNSKLHKSFLEITNEAMKNPNAKNLLHKFYSLCFEIGTTVTLNQFPKKIKIRGTLSITDALLLCVVLPKSILLL